MSSSIFYPGWAIRPEYYQTYNTTDSCVDYGFFSPAENKLAPIAENLPKAEIIYAHSMGCINALKAAAEGTAQALILFSPFCSFCAGQTAGTVDAMIKQLAISPARLLKSFYRSAMNPEKIALESGTELNAAKLEEGLHYLKDSNLINQLSSIKIPVLILAGTDDLIVPLHLSEHTKGLITTSTIKVFEGAGHMLPLTRVSESKKLIDEFLRKAGF